MQDMSNVKETKEKVWSTPSESSSSNPMGCPLCRSSRRIHHPTKGKDPLNLKALTMIDPSTGWFEIVQPLLIMILTLAIELNTFVCDKKREILLMADLRKSDSEAISLVSSSFGSACFGLPFV